MMPRRRRRRPGRGADADDGRRGIVVGVVGGEGEADERGGDRGLEAVDVGGEVGKGARWQHRREAMRHSLPRDTNADAGVGMCRWFSYSYVCVNSASASNKVRKATNGTTFST